MTDLERAVQTLLSTDDYEIVGRGLGWVKLIYVHNDPPHPVIQVSDGGI